MTVENTDSGRGSIADNPQRWMYNLVYGVSLVAIFLFFTARSVVLVKVDRTVSTSIHPTLLRLAFSACVTGLVL